MKKILLAVSDFSEKSFTQLSVNQNIISTLFMERAKSQNTKSKVKSNIKVI